MARLDGREPDASLPLFETLRQSDQPEILHATTRVLSRWSDRPVAVALRPALEALLEERGVADLNRMAAAGLLEVYGQEVDYPKLLRRMEDLGGVARRAIEPILRAGGSPFSLSRILDQLSRMPRAQILALIDDLRETGDARAELLFSALAHAPDPDLAVAALAGLDALVLEESAPALQRVAERHADEMVRRQAALTRSRVEVAEEEDAEPAPIDVGAALAFASAPGPAGSALLLALRGRESDGLWNVLTLFAGEAGTSRHLLVEGLDDAELEAVRARFTEQSLPLEPLALTEARRMMDAAVRAGMATAGLAGLEGGPGPEAMARVSVAPVVWLLALERMDGRTRA